MYTLRRVTKTQLYVYGALLDPSGVPIALTLELPDLGNKPQVSCIPAGKYTASRYASPHLGYTVWKLNNVPNRNDVEIHVGNTTRDIKGCIALGLMIGRINSNMAVLQSQSAFNDFMAFTAQETILDIEVLDPCV